MTTPAVTQPLPPRADGRRGWSLVLRIGGLVLAVLVTQLFLAFLLGGGWYFSGAIHADGLEVEPRSPQYGQEVVAVGRRTITIADPADEQPILDGGDVWGIRWHGTRGVDRSGGAADEAGYGQISGQGTLDDDVTRDLEIITGRPPRPGDLVAFDRSSFPAVPEEVLDRPVADVPYGPADLPAWFVPGDSTTWAVLVHGKGANRAEMLRMMRSTVAADLPSLAITYRNDVETTQDASGMYQYGRTEWRDLEAAVVHAQENGAEQVVLVGASMGGAIIAAYLEHVPDAPVSALVLDSPMLDFGATVDHAAGQRTLPVIGQVPQLLTWTAKRLAGLRYDVDFGELDYVTDSAWLDVPTLVFHGSDDSTTPVALSEQLAADHPDEVELVVVAGAGHVASWNADPEAYDAALSVFLRRL